MTKSAGRFRPGHWVHGHGRYWHGRYRHRRHEHGRLEQERLGQGRDGHVRHEHVGHEQIRHEHGRRKHERHGSGRHEARNSNDVATTTPSSPMAKNAGRSSRSSPSTRRAHVQAAPHQWRGQREFCPSTRARSATSIAVNGQGVKPLEGRRFPISVAQRLDLLVELPARRRGLFHPRLPGGRSPRTEIILASPGAAVARLATAGGAAGPYRSSTRRGSSVRPRLGGEG